MANAFDLICNPAELHSLASEWDELYSRSAPRNPFLSRGWVTACWHHLCAGADPYVLTARRNGRLVGIAPLRMDRELGFRVLRFIGNGWSDYQGFLVDPDERGLERELLAELDRRRGDWDLLVMRQLSEEFTELASASGEGQLGTATCAGGASSYLQFPGDWGSLLKNGPSWLRNYARRLRRFEREGGEVCRLTGAEAAARMELVSAIEARSWKLAAGVARLQPGPGHRALRDAFALLGDQGELELWLAMVHGQPAAYEINYVTPHRLWLYQGAYDERFRSLGAGGVLEYLSVQRAWEVGVREYDYLSGDESYKAERTDRTRPLIYRAFYPKTAKGMAAYGMLLAPRWQLRELSPARTAWKWVHQLPRRLRKTASVLVVPGLPESLALLECLGLVA